MYALLAIGLVLSAYKTSGVFNIAFGVQVRTSGALYYVLHTTHNVNAIPSFIVSVVVLAPLIGVVLDRLFWRWLRNRRRRSHKLVDRDRFVGRDTRRSCS